MATKGLGLPTRSDFLPLGHFVLAGADNRLALTDQAAREASLGCELDAKLTPAKEASNQMVLGHEVA